MYLPKSKYKTPKHTRGDEYTFLNGGGLYRGYYFETYENRFFTGKEPSPKSKELTIITSDTPSTSVRFTPDKITPTQKDYSVGYYVRYFLKDKRTNRLIETYKEKYLELLVESYIDGTTVKWILKSPAKDIIVGGYVYQGAENKNIESTYKQETELPGLKDYIKSYKEFVE